MAHLTVLHGYLLSWVVKLRPDNYLGRYETYLATQELAIVVDDSSCNERSQH